MSIQKLYKRILQGLFFLALTSPLVVDRRLFFPYVTGSSLYFRLIAELLFALWIIFILVYPAYWPKKNWLLGAVFFYLIALVLATVFSSNPYLSFWGDAERMMGLFAILHFFALFLVGTSIFQDSLSLKGYEEKVPQERTGKKELWILICFYSAVSLIAAFYGILQRYGLTSIKPNELRIVSTMGNAGTFAGYLIFGLFLSAFLALQGQKKYWKVFGWVSVLIHIIALFFTGTRGAYLGAGIGFLVAFFIIVLKMENKKLKRGALAGIGVLLACYVFLLFNPRLAEVSQYTYRLTHFSFADSTLQTRLLAWKWGFKGFLDKPVLGYGLENYAVPYNKYFEAKYYNLSPEEYFDRAHNIVVELLSTCGIVGLLAYLFLFGVMAFYLRKTYKKDHDPYYAGIFLGLIVAYFVQNLFIFDLLPNMIGLMILLVILANSMDNGEFKSNSQSVDDNVRVSERDEVYKNIVPKASSKISKQVLLSEEDKLSRHFVVASNFIIIPLSFVLFGGLLYSYQVLIKKPYQALKDNVAGQVLLPYKFDEGMEYLKSSVNYHTFLDLDLSSSAANTIFNYYQESGKESDSKKSDIEYAINLYKDDLKYLPNDTYYNFKIADIINYRFSLDLDEKFIPEARSYIDKAISTSPNRTRVYFRLTDNLLMAGKLDEAITNAEKTVEMNKDFREAYWELTKVYYITNKYEKAKETLIKTIDIGYRISEENLQRMMHLFDIGASKENEIQYYELVIKNGTSNYLYYTTLANLYYETGQKEKAIKCAAEALKINPEIKDQIEAFIKEIERDGK